MKKVLFAPLAAVFLAACNDSADPVLPVDIVISQVAGSALVAAYVVHWAPLEAAAEVLRNSPLYTIQNFSWWNNGTPPIYNSYSITSSRVEYAHAAGLTGAGQIISVVDNGFLQTHGEFSGKTIYVPTGAVPGVDDHIFHDHEFIVHGTTVASVAAGVATGGQMIGVAPGADLALGLFDTDASRMAANIQALALDAIVQNNSWGFEIDATFANFQSVFSGPNGPAYFNSISNLAEQAVIVFAMSNDNSRTTADVMAALPLFDPSLQNNWITVINVVPVISARCLEAAAWCLAADGAIYGASSGDNSDYVNNFGSSFAAPQVAGSIALLAEAFPTLNAEELRARLLASADNNFFPHTGYVEFAPGVLHGFNTEFGHGFLNMKAALSPIGGSYLPRSDGSSVAVDSPTIASAGMIGDALTSRLAQFDLVIVDGLGAGFDLPASVLSAQGVATYDPLASISDLMATDLNNGAVDPFAPLSGFSAFAPGKEVVFEGEDTRFAMLVPDGQSDNFGVSVSRNFGAPGTQFRLGLSAMREGAGFVGVQSLLTGSAISAAHAGATWEWAVPVSANAQFGLSGSFGLAMPEGDMTDLELSAVSYNSINMNYSMRNVWGTGDRVVLGIGLPQAIQSGQADVTLPVANSAGGTTFDTVNVPLSAQGRQMDLSIAYGVPLSRQSDLIMRVVRSLNSGNIDGQNTSEATIGLRFEF